MATEEIRRGLSSRQIESIIKKLHQIGLEVSDTLGSHGIAHIMDPQYTGGSLGYITPSTVGLIVNERLSYTPRSKIGKIALQI